MNKQRKIEELEAQLNEAEDVITDLRAELKQVWVELEKKKNSKSQLLEGQIIKEVASVEASANPEAMVSIPLQEHECLKTCDVKNEHSKEDVLDGTCYNSIKQTELLYISNLEDCYAHNSDLASIIMTGKKPELYKNGCTQRIRALEGKSLDDKMLARDEPNGCFGISNGLVVKESGKEVAKFKTPSSKTEEMKINKHAKRRRRQKGKGFSCTRSCFIPCSDKGACSLPSIKPCAVRKSRRSKRFRPVKMGSSVPQCSKPSFTPKKCSSVSNNGIFCEDQQNEKLKPVPQLTDVEPVHGSTSVTESIKMVSQFGLEKETVKRDNELLNACFLENSVGSFSQKLTVPSSNMKVEDVDVPCTSIDLEDVKTLGENNGSSGQADEGKLLKYTFHRKRKKVFMGNPEGKINPEKSTVKRRMGEEQNGASEPQKSIDDSSRDSWGLAQVARQVCVKPLCYYSMHLITHLDFIFSF